MILIGGSITERSDGEVFKYKIGINQRNKENLLKLTNY